MLRLFRGTGPGVILLMALVAVGLWMYSFTNSEIRGGDEVHDPMVLYGILQTITGLNPLIGKITALVLVLVITSALIAFNTNTFFINERTFLPGIQYIILTSLFPAFQFLTPVLPASIFLIMAVMRIAGSYRKNGIAYSYFDAALMIGAGSLFYASLIWFGTLLFIGILLLRTFNLREVFVSVLGLLTPYIILYGVYFVADYDLAELTRTVSRCLFDSNPGIIWSRMTIVTSVFILITILIASFYLFSVFTTKKVKSRKIFSLQIWTGIVTLLVYFISPSAGEELIFIFAIPASYILSHYHIQRKRKKIVPEIMFSGTIVLIVLLQILSF
ncbi:MAG: DUF6427 family protein [Bacteroidales bacterium]